MLYIINKIKNYRYFLLLLIIMPMLEIIYFLINIFSRPGVDITIKLDKMIPFMPVFIIFYVYWYVYVYLGILFMLFKNRKEYIKLLLSIVVSVSICYVIYCFFPTEITRPSVENKGLLNKIVIFIYNNDKPVNCFPSVHVLKAYLLMRFIKPNYSKLWFYYTRIVGALIILSTVFIKQHFVLDIVGAVILSEVIFRMVKRVNEKYFDKIVNFISKDEEENLSINKA